MQDMGKGPKGPRAPARPSAAGVSELAARAGGKTPGEANCTAGEVLAGAIRKIIGCVADCVSEGVVGG
ncbi:hypothetical protein PQX77_009217, partial [Marasmius sp. AFHP31]